MHDRKTTPQSPHASLLPVAAPFGAIALRPSPSAPAEPRLGGPQCSCVNLARITSRSRVRNVAFGWAAMCASTMPGARRRLGTRPAPDGVQSASDRTHAAHRRRLSSCTTSSHATTRSAPARILLRNHAIREGGSTSRPIAP